MALQALPAPVVLPVDVRAARRRGRHARGQVHLEHEGERAVGRRRRDLVLLLFDSVLPFLPRRRGVEGRLVRAVRGPGQVQGGPAGKEAAARLAVVSCFFFFWTFFEQKNERVSFFFSFFLSLASLSKD